MTRRLLIPVVLVLAGVAWAQMSVDEAQRRLNHKLTTRPAATQPLSEIDQLRAENRRLREQNMELTNEVDQLRTALANSGPATAPTTRGALNSSSASLLGRWQGGDLQSGNAFITEFTDDGAYQQSWFTSPHREKGHWSMPSDTVLEMWTEASGDSQPHNRWSLNLSKTDLTLRPMKDDGTINPAAKPLVMHRMP